MTRPIEIAEEDRLMTPAEVCAAFGISRQTLCRWANRGWVSSIRTPGNTRRFREAEVRALLAGNTREADGRCGDCGYLTARCACRRRP